MNNVWFVLELISKVVSLSVLILGVLCFVFKRLVSEKMSVYFKTKFAKEIADYKQNLLKEIEFYKTGLLKEIELYKLNVENKKYITTKIIDKRLEAYERIIALMNKVVVDIYALCNAEDNPQVQAFLKAHLPKKMDALRGAIQDYSFYIRKELDFEITRFNNEMAYFDLQDKEKASKLLDEFGVLREKLKADMLITEDFSSLDEKIKEK